MKMEATSETGSLGGRNHGDRGKSTILHLKRLDIEPQVVTGTASIGSEDDVSPRETDKATAPQEEISLDTWQKYFRWQIHNF